MVRLYAHQPKESNPVRKKLMDMQPVDDYVTQHTPGLRIWEENWGGMQVAYHIFAPGTDFTQTSVRIARFPSPARLPDQSCAALRPATRPVTAPRVRPDPDG
jgi:hypothetical protein